MMHHHHQKLADRLNLFFFPILPVVSEEDMASVTLSLVQKVGAGITPADAKDHPAPVTGIVWGVDHPEIATVLAAADGLSSEVTAVAVGTAVITVTAMNSDNQPLTETGTVTITAAPAAKLNLAFGTPA